MKDYAVSLGVKPEDILLEEESRSTADHVKNLAPYFAKDNDQSILIVTSSYHTRRSLYIFNKLSEDQDITFYIAPVESDVDYSSWWYDYEMAEKVILEWGRLLFYFIYY